VEKPERNTLNLCLSIIIPALKYKKAARLPDFPKNRPGRADRLKDARIAH